MDGGGHKLDIDTRSQRVGVVLRVGVIDACYRVGRRDISISNLKCMGCGRLVRAIAPENVGYTNVRSGRYIIFIYTATRAFWRASNQLAERGFLLKERNDSERRCRER